LESGSIFVLGEAALRISTKYEEITPPKIESLPKKLIDSMEFSILYTIEWQIPLVTSLTFLFQFATIEPLSQTTVSQAQFLCEVGLFDSKFNKYKPSVQAAAALYATLRLQSKEKQSCWSSKLQKHTKYRSADLKQCAVDLLTLTRLI
jgi:G2/mitotic-specific cyclin 1/2